MLFEARLCYLVSEGDLLEPATDQQARRVEKVREGRGMQSTCTISNGKESFDMCKVTRTVQVLDDA